MPASCCVTRLARTREKANQIGDFATTCRLTFWSPFLPVRLHGHVRVQVVERSVSLLASLMPAFVHALDFFVATTGAFVLLRSRNRNEGVHLRQRVWWTLFARVRRDARRGINTTYLARTWRASRRLGATGRHARARRTVRSTGHSRMMTITLPGPVTITLRGVTRVLRHLVALGSVRRIRAGERRTRLSDGRIYRDVGVRLDAWSVMMVMVMAILQRHGRTCSLRHTCCRVIILSVVLLTRNEFGRKVCRTRRSRIGVLGAGSGGWMIIRRANLLLWGVLRSRCWICGRGLGSVRSPMWFTDECANLTASIGRVQLCPSIRVDEEKEVKD